MPVLESNVQRGCPEVGNYKKKVSATLMGHFIRLQINCTHLNHSVTSKGKEQMLKEPVFMQNSDK